MTQRTPRGLRACDYAEGLRIAKHDHNKKHNQNRYKERKAISESTGIPYGNVHLRENKK